MSEPQKVYFCDECNRVVAREENGKVVIIQRHDKAEHRTEIKPKPPVV